MPNINDFELSSESDELAHPNIDKKSLIEFKRAEKQRRRKVKEETLQYLLDNNGDNEEINKLKFELSEKVEATSERMVIGDRELEPRDKDILVHIAYLLNHANINDFVHFMDSNNVCLEVLEDNVLYNLSECIKSGHDDVGLDFARISLYIKCAKQDGGNTIRKLAKDMDKNGMMKLDTECKLYYEDAKQEILKLCME